MGISVKYWSMVIYENLIMKLYSTFVFLRTRFVKLIAIVFSADILNTIVSVDLSRRISVYCNSFTVLPTFFSLQYIIRLSENSDRCIG